MKYICIIFMISMIFSCSSESRTNKELEAALGINLENPQLIYQSDVMGGFNEGYTMEILKLSDKNMQEFQKTVKSQEYPLEDHNWQVINWKESPFADSLIGVKELVLNYYIKDRKTRSYQNEIRKLLEIHNKVYYSAYYKEVAENIVSVKFYLVDINAQKVYLVKSNI